MAPRYMKTPFTPTAITLVAIIFWALLMMTHVLFWSSSFDWLQNIAIGFLSLVMIGCVVGFIWVYWGFRRA